MLGGVSRYFLWRSFSKISGKINIIDVGSAGERPYFWPDNSLANYYEFEPNEDGGSVGLGSVNLKRKLYVSKNDHMSSVYKPKMIDISKVFHEKHWKERGVVEELEIKIQRLDEILDPASNVDFIKIDTQGSEYEILKGAKKTIEKCRPIIYCECWLYEVYSEAPLFSKVFDLLKDWGYEICAIETGAAWDMAINEAGSVGRKVPIGLDIIAAPREVIDNAKDLYRPIEKSVVLEMYGQYQLALNISRSASVKNKEFHPFYKWQKIRINSMMHRKITSFLDLPCRGKMRRYKIVPNLYD